MRSERCFKWATIRGAFVTCLLFVFLSACSDRSKTKEIEILLAEINEISSRKDESISQIPESVRQGLSSDSIERFPDSRQIMETAAKQALPFYDNDLHKFNLIANKYEQMEALDVNPEYMESVSIQKRLYRNYAKGIQLQKSRLELLLDSNILDREDLMNRSRAIESQLSELKKEIDNLEELSNKNKIFSSGQN